MHDPFIKQEANRLNNRNNLQLRSRLQTQGNDLERKARLAIKENNRDNKLIVQGELLAYVALRQLLTPDIALDMHCRQLEALAFELKKACIIKPSEE